MSKQTAHELGVFLKTSLKDVAVLPLTIIVTLAVGNAAFQVTRNALYQPDVRFGVENKNNMFGAPSAEEHERRTREHYYHAVRNAGISSYHKNLQRYGIEESE
eukprot:TRINITY_DN187_c0_g2_i5.p1 TRINITY_DN187_c0_g2~~TRINITY_DN187_c0_g2_i5.p1  ORF type:complete len:103 (+),score=20.26 TRINITY_DN187_c0_g2_i5:65-373(+)